MDSSNWLVCANSLFLFSLMLYIRETIDNRTNEKHNGRNNFWKKIFISSCNSFLSLSIVRKKDQRGIKFSWRTTKWIFVYGKIDCMKIFQSRCNHDYFNEICQELNICHILRDQYDTLCYLVKMINICIYWYMSIDSWI
jgi:hypothetical protein